MKLITENKCPEKLQCSSHALLNLCNEVGANNIMESGVYKIQSIQELKKSYIGASKNLQSRKEDHFSLLSRAKHPNKKLQNHFNQYGKSDLQFEILIRCSIEELGKYESFYINKLKPYFNSQNKSIKSTKIYRHYKHSKFLEFLKIRRYGEVSFIKEYNSHVRERNRNSDEVMPFLNYYIFTKLLAGNRNFRNGERDIYCKILEITKEELHKIFNR